MVEINGGIAATPPPTAYPTPTVAPNHHAQASDHVGHSQLAVSATDAGSGRSDGKKSDAKKPDHANDIVISFNPSTRIDPDTHIVVLTIRDEAENCAMGRGPSARLAAQVRHPRISRSRASVGSATGSIIDFFCCRLGP